MVLQLYRKRREQREQREVTAQKRESSSLLRPFSWRIFRTRWFNVEHEVGLVPLPLFSVKAPPPPNGDLRCAVFNDRFITAIIDSINLHYHNPKRHLG